MQSNFEAAFQKLIPLCDQLPPCQIFPHQLFVAWHGVITMMFRAFPEPIAALKRDLNQLGELPDEGPGSRWPKMTIAALGPNCPLQSEELDQLLSITHSFTAKIQNAPPITVDELTVVDYEQQSIESVLERRSIPLLGSCKIAHDLPPLQTEVSELVAQQHPPLNESARQLTLSPGRDASHYRQRERGISLIIEAPNVYQDLITSLRDAITAALPNRYEWFSAESRHVTIRALS